MIGLRDATAALLAAQQASTAASDKLGGPGTEPGEVVDAVHTLIDALDRLLVLELSRPSEIDGRHEPDESLVRLAVTLREVRDLTVPQTAVRAPTTAVGEREKDGHVS